MKSVKAFRGALLYCLDDPAKVPADEAICYHDDGLLIIEGGKIVASGDARELLPQLPAGVEVQQVNEGLIIPGFIDTHVHFPQIDIIASYGEQLLDWLNTYTFPEELRFSDADYCQQQAERFIAELLRNGTTTALVFGTVHPASVDALFRESEKHSLCMIAGKVMMDRHAPEGLCDSAEQGYAESRALIERWHKKGRLHYAVTPRFAPTSTSAQLHKAGELLQEFPDVYLHTHLSENTDEIAWVRELFPEQQDYLDVYDHHGLLRDRAVFAHGIHLSSRELTRLAQTGSAVAFCPSSNLFLGSGLFNLKGACEHGVHVGLGTDVGAGTSFSLLQTMGDGYKTQQLRGERLHPWQAFYLATLGGARALKLESRIGTLAAGSDADFVILDYAATPLLSQRLKRCSSMEERLFALMVLGDDRAIRQTWANGQQVYQQSSQG